MSFQLWVGGGRVLSMIIRTLVVLTLTLSGRYIFIDIILPRGTSLLSSLIWKSSDDLFSGLVPISLLFCFHS